MREMAELTDILHNATEDSLVLLDEVGRGTSTTDGLAIAWATTEFVDDEVGATTLFATHYHELTAIADEREAVTNLHFTASREDGDVTFLHRVAEGASSSSYGVEVAALAGVPEAVVERSRTLIAEGVPVGREDDRTTLDDFRGVAGDGAAGLNAPAGATNGQADGDGESAVDDGTRPAEGDGETAVNDASDRLTARGDVGDVPDRPAADAATDETLREVAAELREVDVADTTPLEALNLLNDLRTRLDDRDS
jgi:DNA mismatch repair protein MutS